MTSLKSMLWNFAGTHTHTHTGMAAILKLNSANNRKSCKYLNTTIVVSAADCQDAQGRDNKSRARRGRGAREHNPKTEIDENLFELHLHSVW